MGRTWYVHKWSKAQNVNVLSKAFDSRNFLQEWTFTRSEKSPKSLLFQTRKFIMETMHPMQLPTSYALAKHKIEKARWEKECHVDNNLKIPSIRNDSVKEVLILCYPQFSLEHNTVEFSTLDYTHILTNM